MAFRIRWPKEIGHLAVPWDVENGKFVTRMCQQKIHFIMSNSFHGGVTATSDETRKSAVIYRVLDAICVSPVKKRPENDG
jgi:hypothetical protein